MGGVLFEGLNLSSFDEVATLLCVHWVLIVLIEAVVGHIVVSLWGIRIRIVGVFSGRLYCIWRLDLSKLLSVELVLGVSDGLLF